MKIIIAAGGTAGHINPGIAIAKFLQQKMSDVEILFVGTERGLETKLVPIEGYSLRLINVKGFKREVSKDTLLSIKEMFQGYIQARKIIKSFKPDIVVGTGGYVCGPVLLCAALNGINTLIHEQNALPGVTNKILSRFVKVVATSFGDSQKYFKSAKKVVFTGNPVRIDTVGMDKNTAKDLIGVDKSKPLVIVFGGSRGAEKINSVVSEMIANELGNKDCNILFATGEVQYYEMCKYLDRTKKKSFTVMPYIYNMNTAMKAADLIICRAGATTISELTAYGVPSILIPSPNVTANHQEFNARELEKNGAAEIIIEKDLNSKMLYNNMMRLLLDKQKLAQMENNAKKMGIVNASENIYELMRNMFLLG